MSKFSRSFQILCVELSYVKESITLAQTKRSFKKIKSAKESRGKEFVKEGLGSVPYLKEWRKGHFFFGVDPIKFKCSREAIARRGINCDPIPHFNKLVDSYNHITLKYHTPCGGEDIDKMRGAYSQSTQKEVKRTLNSDQRKRLR